MLKKIAASIGMFLVVCTVTLALAENAAAARFVKHDNGTVTDTQTGLTWAGRDNGANLTWFGAKSYCEGYTGGGSSGWRMPTIDELAALWAGGGHRGMISLSTGFVWSSNTGGLDSAYYMEFEFGSRFTFPQSITSNIRALPVRSGK